MAIISSVEELRLYSPANAIDHIDSIAGMLDSSEHDFLEDKLGANLYRYLTDFYGEMRTTVGVSSFIAAVTSGEPLVPNAQLLRVCQRMVCYDALSRNIDIQAVSVNGGGVNMAVADDYGKADRESIRAYKASCVREAHAALNQLLVLLEQFYKTYKAMPEGELKELDEAQQQIAQISSLWENSRYFFLAAHLIMPSAVVLQDYLDIYESREKFILMLPDLRYTQEDIIAPVIGESLLDALVTVANEGTEDRLLCSLIHQLRKVAARHLEARTFANKNESPRREHAKNEAAALMDRLVAMLKNAQGRIDPPNEPSAYPDFIVAAWRESPLYAAALEAPASPPANAEKTEEWKNNKKGNVMFITPSL